MTRMQARSKPAGMSAAARGQQAKVVEPAELIYKEPGKVGSKQKAQNFSTQVQKTASRWQAPPHPVAEGQEYQRRRLRRILPGWQACLVARCRKDRQAVAPPTRAEGGGEGQVA